MKILQITKLYLPHLGGVENTTRDIADYLAADDSFQSDVLVCQEKGPRAIENWGRVKVHRAASFGRLFSLPISLDFFSLFKKVTKDYDLLLIHHPFPLASLARFFFTSKKQVVTVWYHSDIVRQKFFYFLVYPFLYLDLKSAKTIFIESHRLAEYSPLLQKFMAKCSVIPLSVDLNYYQADYALPVASLKNKYGRFMLAVGRLVYYKGFLVLLEAMKTAPGKLLIIGTGPLEQKMREIIMANHLEAKVIIISDHPANLVPYYQACEFLVFSSNARSETFGMVQIEAMACSKPIINTDLPTGVPWVSLDGESGLTVPVDNPEKLSGAIKTLWEDDDLRLKLSAGAKKRAATLFSRDKFNADLKALVKSQIE